MEETLYDDTMGDTEVGETWFGGFPDELKVLDNIGIENPETLNEDQLQSFRSLMSEWAPEHFEKNYGEMGDYFKAVFPDEKEREQFHQLITNPVAARKMFEIFKRHETMKEFSEENKKGQIDFSGTMSKVMRQGEINDLRSQLILEKFKHLTSTAGENFKRGK